MPWLTEHGIGETRSLLIERGEVIAARLAWPGELAAGGVHSARLTKRLAGTRRGIVTLESEAEALIDHLPPDTTEGTAGTVRVTRAPIHERGRLKRAQARWIGPDEPQPEPVCAPGSTATRPFAAGLWEEVWLAAASGRIAFPGGEILCSATPAMTVIDIDGDKPPRALALAALPAIAQALRWFDLGGNIGIDFPTLTAKADRRAVDEALAQALADWPHERTAMNGFGFVQIVARLEGPSLLHRFATARLGLCARFGLRMAERAVGDGGFGGGALLLTIHPALKAQLKPHWLAELARRTGREVRIATHPGLALEAPHAQIVAA